MSHDGLPPLPPACLERAYSSSRSRKGGTLIVEEVGDLETHEQRRRDPDGYRPAACPSCGHDKLHVHDYRVRERLPITLVRYLCPACKATWRMLPLFAARMLWRSWPTVEGATIGPASPSAVRVPERTVRRWRARLATAAASLVEVLRRAGETAIVAAATAVEATATRLRLVVACAEATAAATGQRLSRLAATIHSLVPGVRLM
jgi:hypothetical protein